VTRLKDGVPWKFAGPTTYWLETYAKEGGTDLPNDRWCTRARGQIEKCAEAAALRKAFPELGNEYTSEEMHGQRIRTSRPRAAAYVPEDPMDALPPPAPPPPPPIPPEEDEEAISEREAQAERIGALANLQPEPETTTINRESLPHWKNAADPPPAETKPKTVTARKGPVAVKGDPAPKKPKPLPRAEANAKLKMAERLIEACASPTAVREVETTLAPIIAALNVADALFVRKKLAEAKAFFEGS
jgi:hypothetical protein